MIKRTGYADLPLHVGTVPKWLADRMMELGTLIVESLIINYGKEEVLRRLSDPLWFQSFGAVLGMDWHSSGITTSVMYALKRGINRRAKDFGLCVCGGRGKYSRKTPDELLFLADATGLDGDKLVRTSKLTAKVDSTAIQDGFQLYQHNFVLADTGEWAVIQQGMNPENHSARRYHWCSENVKDFCNEPHTAVTGENRGKILNLTAKDADTTKKAILEISHENPDKVISECKKIIESNSLPKSPLKNTTEPELFENPEVEKTQILLYDNRNLTMPDHHEVRAEDVDLKRLGGVLATAYSTPTNNFEDLLLTQGLGPRTLQTLTLVSEVIYGTPSRFYDPARFSFANGGKDGHPFPVPLKVYDNAIQVLQDSIEKSNLGYKEKSEYIKRLHTTAQEIEKNCSPEADFEKTLAFERANSKNWGGKTV